MEKFASSHDELEVRPDAVDSRIGDLLVSAGVISRPDVEAAAADAQTRGIRLGQVLIERARITERDIYRQLAIQHGLLFSDQEYLLKIAEPSLIKRVPRKFLERYHVLPITRIGKTLVVASSNVTAFVPDLARALEAEQVQYHLVTPTDFRRLRMAFDLGMTSANDPKTGPQLHDADLLAPEAMDAAYTSVFDAMMLEAIAERASDIHLERYKDRIRLRLRVDGDLHDVPRFRLTVEQYQGLVNVIKIKAGLDIAEHRVPQGGRYSTQAGSQFYDLRVQTQPSFYGEHITIRLLSKEMERIYIEQLGLPPRLTDVYKRLLNNPSGLILVVGPTGCGKSTTLYAGLHLLANDETRKIITVEDPIECSIENVQQTQVRPDLGFAFAQAMRAFVREDPDVILVGEIRDAETAIEALRASQTGHLVLSTLHCNDAVDAIQRLLDLGMHPNTVGSELLAVFAQRLAKRLCTSCKEPVEPEPALIKEIFPAGKPEEFQAFRGRGCTHCGGFGTYGRIAIVEYLPVGPEIRKAISRRLPIDELRDLARSLGLTHMRDHAIDLVREGVIALEELPAMFSLEQLQPQS